MGLAQALSTSLAGLNATQASISVVAGNIANANTPGYVTQTATQNAITSGTAGDSVRVAGINRILDTFVQQQLRSENSGGGYATTLDSFYQQLQQVYGQPGSDTALDSVFNNFTSALQSLATSPSSSAAQAQALNAAQSLAQQLNNATTSIQGLRSQADQGIANDVQQANIALQQIANINQQLATAAPNDSSKALLENQRDSYVDQLSKLMDIRVVQNDRDQISVFTSSGTQLAATQASQLQFNPTGSFTASLQYNVDPSKSTLSGITLVGPAGGSGVDLIANGSIRSGELAGYLNMRDNVLVQAQTQMDAVAAQLSSSLSDTTTAGTAATVGLQQGFTTDVAGLQTGNTIHVTYTDALNVSHNVSIVRVDDPSVLPLPNNSTVDPNDTVVGVDFSGGLASVVSQLNTALGGTGLQFSNPAGTTLRVLDSGPGSIAVNNVSTTTTATSLTSGGAALPLFVDGSSPYTGATNASGAAIVGFAGRITVNTGLIADPTKLVTYSTSPQTPVGDATRPNYLYDQLVNTSFAFSPDTGIGGVSSPYQGTLSGFMSQVISKQSVAATAATNLKDGQDIVVNALQTRFNATSAVSIDTEMAHLLTLQNSYGANARVMSTVKAMLDSLMQVLG